MNENCPEAVKSRLALSNASVCGRQRVLKLFWRETEVLQTESQIFPYLKIFVPSEDVLKGG